MKTARYIFLAFGFLFCGSVYFCTESSTFKEWFGIIKPDDGFFSTDRYHYGDLFGLSFVSQFKEKQKLECTYNADTCNHAKNISLYILGDSYIYKFISEKQFCGIKSLTICDWDGGINFYSPDASTKKILIIESTERYVYSRFVDSMYASYKFQLGENENSSYPKLTASESWRDYFSDNNNHIEALLFDYPLFTQVKQVKGDINYNWFHRLPSEVVASKSGNRLFLSETVSNNLLTSSFSKVNDKFISQLVSNMNAVREHYLHRGFAEVYFSFIPNPVSLLEPQRGTLNHLIERIQNNPAKKFLVIDCYSLAKQNPVKFFRRSDTHWTSYGCNLWVQRANEILNEFRNG